jgi:hypothetical protein
VPPKEGHYGGDDVSDNRRDRRYRRATAAQLLDKNRKVRGLAHRKDERSEHLSKLGAEVVFGDFLDFNATRAALKGVDRAYFCYPIRPGIVQATAHFAQAALEAGVEFIVNMSQKSAGRKSDAARQHWLAEGPGRRAGLSRFQEFAMTALHSIASLLGVSVSDWEVMRAEHERRDAELRPANRTAVFDALAAAGVTIVVVAFDGYGNSGQIDIVEAKAGEDVAALPSGEVEIASAVWGETEPERMAITVHGAIGWLVFDLLEMTHDGWENSNGAYGDFTFDVAERTITLDYNKRCMPSEISQHVF